MESKIKSLTIVNLQGSKTYFVGTTYNGLLLDHIDDCSLEYPESFVSIFTGGTKSKNTVFTVINAPIEIEWEVNDGD